MSGENVPENDFGYPMNFCAYATRGIIWGQRLLFSKILKGFTDHQPMRHSITGQAVNDAISGLLSSGRPCFVGRFGCVELDAALRGWDISRQNSKLLKAVRIFTGNYGPFWWDNSIKAGLLRTAGVFPAEEDVLMRFSARTLDDSRELDVLGSWNAREQQLANIFFPKAKGVPLDDILPFFFKSPWSEALRGKDVLVINPFVETIKKQYSRREELFADRLVLPEFNLITYKPVTSFLGLDTPYKDWFDALEAMCSDISKIRFDVAILGCGAYGFSMGAFIKRELRRQAIHLGGATQLLFGIKGGRWDKWPRFSSFYNDAWTRPGLAERPANFRQHEGGAYW